MQAAVSLRGTLERLLDHLVCAEFALLDRLVDADDILPYHAAGADVEMPNFRVAHQALWQSDGQRGGLKLGVSIGVAG